MAIIKANKTTLFGRLETDFNFLDIHFFSFAAHILMPENKKKTKTKTFSVNFW